MSGGHPTRQLRRSWFGLWALLPLTAQFAIPFWVYFQPADAARQMLAMSGAQSWVWPGLVRLHEAVDADIAVRMQAAVLAGLAVALASTVYLVVLFMLGMGRNDRVQGGLKTALLALIFPVLILGLIFLWPDVHMRAGGSRRVPIRPDALGLVMMALLYFAAAFFTALAVLGLIGSVRGIGRRPEPGSR